MRRRSRMKTLKILQLLTPARLITLAILFLCNRMSAEPGYLDFDNLPETNFTCAGKVIGGYYADLETSCQMFHVCTIGQLDEPMDIKFLCLNGTVFDQETRVCERVDEVDCRKSEKFYYLNLELYGNTMVPMPEESETADGSSIDTIASSSPSTTKQPSTSPTPAPTTASPTTVKTTTTKPSSAMTKHSNYPHGFNYHHQQNQQQQNSYNDHKLSHSYPTSTPHYVTSTFSPKINSTPANRNPPSTTASGTRNQQDESHSSGSQFEEEEEEEYEYEDDYGVVTEQSEVQSNQPQKPFSPQQFIYDQNKENAKNQHTPTKPAISFQQQRFQNNGPSHFATNHQGNQQGSSANTQQNNQQKPQGQQNQNKFNNNNNNYFIGQPPSGNGQPTTNDRDNQPYHTSTTNRPYSNHNNNYYHKQPEPAHKTSSPSSSASSQQSNQLPKRIPLLTLGQQQQQQLQNNINFQQQQQLTFRVRGSGFQLPAGPPPPPLPQPRPFAGYQRPPPPQIPLHLPFESRSLREQKDLLGFEDVADSLITPQERKDTKRSDPGGGSDKERFNLNQLSLNERRSSNNSTSKSVGVQNHNSGTRENDNSNDNNRQGGDEDESSGAQQDDNQQSGSQKQGNLKKYSTTFSTQQQATAQVTDAKKAPKQSQYEKLLIPQERYKSTLPKIIITASASVSASNGKKLNYSLGNLLGQGAELKIPPLTYDDYKEEDVVLDPFFQDVPKIKKH